MSENKIHPALKELFDEWDQREKEIEEKAKKEGTWFYGGLDTNSELFKELKKEMYDRIKKLGQEHERGEL